MRKQREVWDTVPASSVALLLAMVFCVLASIGAISQLASARVSIVRFWVVAGATGAFGALLAWVAIRKTILWGLAISAAAVLMASAISPYMQGHSSPSRTVSNDVKQWIEIGSETTIFLLMLGFAFTMEFIRHEGERFFRTHTEVRLAGEIHRALVPTIEQKIGEYEFYATSVASGTVGGDLIDLIERNGDWLAYVADVSGHGVSSGVVMAMVKGSTQMGMQFDLEPKRLLAGLNEVLCGLKASNMFATCGLVANMLLAYSPQSTSLRPASKRF